MLELTKEECAALEDRVNKEIRAALSNEDGISKLHMAFAKIAVRATILTISEYERMKASDQDLP